MLNKLKQRKSEGGFTIIEVLIVLAIAGLIMVVVFLAVPALQRNGRNNALSTDANNVLAGIGTYVANNAGTLPASGSFVAGTVTLGVAPASPETVKVGGGTAAFSVNGAVITAASPLGTIQAITGATAKCNATGNGIAGAASPRSYVVLYVAESANANIVRCIGN